VLSARDVHKHFAAGRHAQVLRGIDLEVAPGETVAVLASRQRQIDPARAAAGLDMPTRGSVRIDGRGTARSPSASWPAARALSRHRVRLHLIAHSRRRTRLPP
jgi:predicted ABC-type transport system involved in lysophospholipase L1 biosynthesis ATPase subunit